MLRIDWARWGQTPEDLRRLAMSAPHARTRERALALYDIAHESCATTVAERTGRHPQTLMAGGHTYNERGPEALAFRRTGLPVADVRPQPRRKFGPHVLRAWPP